MRIEYALDSKERPTADDIRLVLEPKRLAQRKDLLQRVLMESFDKHGKCVPVIETRIRRGENNNKGILRKEKLEFVTHSNVESLGAFILELLGESKTKKSADDDELLDLLKDEL